MREGQDGVSQSSPSLPLYIAEQESWKGLDTLYTSGGWVFGTPFSEKASRGAAQLFIKNHPHAASGWRIHCGVECQLTWAGLAPAARMLAVRCEVENPQYVDS
jgi:hypothetical protein